MTLYEMTADGPRPLSLAEAADRVYRALRVARPGSRTVMRLIGLRDLANELAIEEALREREARIRAATTPPHRGQSIPAPRATQPPNPSTQPGVRDGMIDSFVRRAGMMSVEG